jgi:hypothetical protein
LGLLSDDWYGKTYRYAKAQNITGKRGLSENLLARGMGAGILPERRGVVERGALP